MTSPEEVLGHLHAWRDWQLVKGASEESVPSEDVLRRIVVRNPATAAELSRMQGRTANPAVDAHAQIILRILGAPPSDPAEDSPDEATASGRSAPIPPSARAETSVTSAGSVPAAAMQPAPKPAPAPPADSGPVESGPVESGPVESGPVESGPVESGPVESGPVGSGPVVSAPVVSEPGTSDAEPDLSRLRFPQYVPGDEEPLRVHVRPSADGLRYSWDESDQGSVVVYRVVISDAYAPWTPDVGDLIATTVDTSAVDTTPGDSAVRHVTVWANAGADLAKASAAPTTLHAQRACVRPVQEAFAQDDGGVAVGSWLTGEGARRVIVLRIPVRFARTAGFDRARFEVCTGTRNVSGFTDRTAERGQTYVYRAFVEADLGEGSVDLSEYVELLVTVAAPLISVTDLVATQIVAQTGEHRVDLTWTAPPVGRVVVYRTEEGPEPDAERETTLLLSQLEQIRLPAEARLNWEVIEEGDQRLMEGISWPDGWTTAYFTPVTIVDDRLCVGPSRTLIRPNPVTDPRLVQRVTWQHLTFGWPAKTDEVKVYVTARDAPLEQPDSALASIDLLGYQAYGGVRLTGQQSLPVRVKGGVDVHIVPMTFHDGEVTVGAAAKVPYNGLLCVQYSLARSGLSGRLSNRRRSLRLRADIDLPKLPPLVLMYLPDRLPLSPRGATMVGRFAVGGVGTEWTTIDDIELPKGPGFVRLFMMVPENFPADVALLDPPVDELRC